MVLIGNDARQVALFITATIKPSAAWLEKVKREADSGSEIEGVQMTVLGAETHDFAGWSTERVCGYVVQEFSTHESPIACRSFAIVDDQSETTNSLLVVSLKPISFEGGAPVEIEGTMRVGPEYGVGMPALFHSDIKGISTFAEAAEDTEDGVMRLPPLELPSGDGTRVRRVLG